MFIMSVKMVNIGNMARKLGYVGQSFYGFVQGVAGKPNLSKGLSSVRGDFHSLEMSPDDATLLLNRVIDYYRLFDINIPLPLIESAREYIESCR